MGMILPFLLLIYIVVSIGIYKFTKRNSPEKWVHRSVLTLLILIPTYDILLTYIFAGCYCLTTPSTYIKEKDSFPKSIYFEDNIYPGFSKSDRKIMIENYLDGKHLKTMALNGDDGKIYVYSANENDWNTSKAIKARKIQGNYWDMLVLETNHIYATTEKVYTKETMPKMNYTVIYQEDPLPFIVNSFLHRDNVKIIKNSTNEIIGYNRRIMNFFYNIAPDFAVGGRHYAPGPICGNTNLLTFDRSVITENARKFVPQKHQQWLNNKYYEKYKMKTKIETKEKGE